jgi:hypothetical protein
LHPSAERGIIAALAAKAQQDKGATMKANQAAKTAALDAGTALKAAEITLDAAGRAVQAAKDAAPPPADPRNESFHAALVAGERSAFARIMPTRNRWSELRAIEERVTAIDQQQAATLDTIHDLFAREREAEAEYPSVLAGWLAAGQKDERPAPTAPGLKQQREEMQALHDALDEHRAAVLAEQVEFMVKHRGRLVPEADKATAAAEARALELVDELAAVREDLVLCREAALWARLYPSEALLVQPDRSIAGGRKQPLERAVPGLRNSVQPERIFELLRQDVRYLAAAATPEQKAALAGQDPRKHGGSEWADTDEGRQRAHERQRLLPRWVDAQ